MLSNNLHLFYACSYSSPWYRHRISSLIVFCGSENGRGTLAIYRLANSVAWKTTATDSFLVLFRWGNLNLQSNFLFTANFTAAPVYYRIRQAASQPVRHTYHQQDNIISLTSPVATTASRSGFDVSWSLSVFFLLFTSRLHWMDHGTFPVSFVTHSESVNLVHDYKPTRDTNTHALSRCHLVKIIPDPRCKEMMRFPLKTDTRVASSWLLRSFLCRCASHPKT